jgi:hypothetical protein
MGDVHGVDVRRARMRMSQISENDTVYLPTELYVQLVQPTISATITRNKTHTVVEVSERAVENVCGLLLD